MSNKPLSPLIAWILFILLALTWGSSFILMKRGLASFDYLQIGLLRIAMAFWFMSFIGIKHLKKISKQNWKPLLVIGIFGNGIPYLLFPLAVTKLDSSLVGILNAMVPVFTLIIGLIWFKIKVKWLATLGVTLGFIGAIVLLLPEVQLDSSKLAYGIYPILATICYAISINTINSKLTNLGPMPITLISLCFVGIPATIALFGTDFVHIMRTDPLAWESFGYIAILGLVGSSLAILLFNYLIKKTTSLFAASVTYAIPIVALAWGVFDGEKVGLNHLFGMLAILLGVYLVNMKGSPAERIRKRLAKKNASE